MYLFLLTKNICKFLELLTELARRERDAGIFPEAEIDLFMKVTRGFVNMTHFHDLRN